MTMNEKYFPKRARFIITNKLIDSIMNVSSNFYAANTIYKRCYRTLKNMDNLFNDLFINDWRLEDE